MKYDSYNCLGHFIKKTLKIFWRADGKLSLIFSGQSQSSGWCVGKTVRDFQSKFWWQRRWMFLSFKLHFQDLWTAHYLWFSFDRQKRKMLSEISTLQILSQVLLLRIKKAQRKLRPLTPQLQTLVPLCALRVSCLSKSRKSLFISNIKSVHQTQLVDFLFFIK